MNLPVFRYDEVPCTLDWQIFHPSRPFDKLDEGVKACTALGHLVT